LVAPSGSSSPTHLLSSLCPRGGAGQGSAEAGRRLELVARERREASRWWVLAMRSKQGGAGRPAIGDCGPRAAGAAGGRPAAGSRDAQQAGRRHWRPVVLVARERRERWEASRRQDPRCASSRRRCGRGRRRSTVGACGPKAVEAGGGQLVGRDEARRGAGGSARPRIKEERMRVEKEGKKAIMVILHFFCILASTWSCFAKCFHKTTSLHKKSRSA
jgi:hypothetical protein